MKEFSLDEKEIQEVAKNRYEHEDELVRKQMTILHMKHHSSVMGLTHDQIATLAGCSRSTLQRTLREFALSGLSGFLKRPAQASRCELDAHRDKLKEIFLKEPPRSVKHARFLIKKHTGIDRGLTQVRLFLRSLGLKPRKVVVIPIPPKSTLEEHVQNQDKFLDEKLDPKLKEAREGKRQLYFMDAAHFVHAGLMGIVWCIARMAIKAASGRKRFNVLGALNSVTHELITVTNHSYINSNTICEMLRVLAAAALPGVPITIVLDNAAYQKCKLVKDLAAQLNIELLHLPSYSPNLNLIERVWKFIKSEYLRAEYYPTYLEFHSAIQLGLSVLHSTHKDAMSSLLSHKFQTFSNVSLLPA